jgi:HK97 family phage prohead protease
VTATLAAPDVLFRAAPAELDVEIRTVAGKRQLRGIVVPFGVEQRIDANLVESFAQSAFSKQLAAPHRVPLFRDHESHGGTLIGKGLEMRADSAGLFGAFRVAPTLAGDEALALVEDGALDQWSIGFMPGQNRRLSNGTVERVTATLTEVALVLRGAYGPHAAVSEVVRQAVCTCGAAAPEPTARLNEVRALLNQLPELPLPLV